MDITLNLATQPYEKAQRFLARWRSCIIGAAVLAFLLTCISLSDFVSWLGTRSQVIQLEAKIKRLRLDRSRGQQVLDRSDNRQLRARSELLNSMIARKAFSWTEVFADLEQIVPPNLHVTSIHPEVNDDDQLELHLAVSGGDRAAALELIRRLEQSSHFEQAQIQDERTQSPQNGQNPGDLIQYNVVAVYIPHFARGLATRSHADKSPQPDSTFQRTYADARGVRH